MLSHLQISNFTLVDKLDLELHSGLSCITGETGAGKSILLDALGLVLGDRADADKVKAGSDKADVQASFDISHQNRVAKWLEEQALASAGECVMRRVVTKEGRSRGFINGQAVTLQQLKALGEQLVDIHGQHEHQYLLKTSSHRRLLDAFGGLLDLAKRVKRDFYHWNSCKEKLDYLQNQTDEVNARFQLLSYQVKELDALDASEGEVEQLELEQKQLASFEDTQQRCNQALALCSDEESGLREQLRRAVRLLSEINPKEDQISESEDLLNQALINVQEAQNSLESQLDEDADHGARLLDVEQRLTSIYDISRKHKVSPEELYALHAKLNDELATLQTGDEQIVSLEAELTELLSSYENSARTLSKAREKAAKKLNEQVNQKLRKLAMEHANFVVDLEPMDNEPRAHGSENIQFLISTNPGQAPKALGKIASGGELSRVSLAIQVVTAQSSTIPSMIFDEVDVGIGGTTGDVVGALLRELGSSAQVICVTHLAQVASKAHHHLLVEKQLKASSMSSSMNYLNEENRVLEVARMMGGAIDSSRSLEHAREMLDQVS